MYRTSPFQYTWTNGAVGTVAHFTKNGQEPKWIVKHYEQRPAIEQDYEQMQSGGWKLQRLSSTRYSEMAFYLVSVLLSYSLYHLFSNTHAGARWEF